MLSRIKWSILLFLLVFLTQSIIPLGAFAEGNGEPANETTDQLLALTVLAVSATDAELVWTSGTNDIEAASYDIFRDGTLISNTSSFVLTDTGLTPETAYTYVVKALDRDGNILAVSNQLEIVTLKPMENENGETEETEETEGNDPVQSDSIRATELFTSLENLKNSLAAKDLNYETDRYIIKYKGEDGSNKFSESFKDSIQKRKEKVFEVISLDKEEKFADLIDELIEQGLGEDIEYVQPDYQIELSSIDPYYENQWGLKDNGVITESEDGLRLSDRTDMLPPHLRNLIKRSPELMEFIRNTPVEELRNKLLTRDMPETIPPHIAMELAHDPMFIDMLSPVPQQPQYLYGGNAAGAWEESTGSGAVVAVIDTGVDIEHEDLSENIWINAGEIPGNGIDDDGDGYVDDINGWNFSDNNRTVYDGSNPGDESHGTHLAGIIAAVKDNDKGIAGVAPSAAIMPLKVFKEGKAYTSGIIDAIKYAESKNVKIINCSWGSTAYNPALEETMRDCPEILFVCAAGNSGADIDTAPVYPASFDLPNIITVASVSSNGGLSGFSNYGADSVDAAAPGEKMESTLPGNAYGQLDGTSMAAAFVSGEAALLAAMSANLSAAQLKERIVGTSDHLSTLTDKVSGGNKINCADAANDISKTDIMQVSETGGDADNVPAIQNEDGFSLFSAPTVEGQFTKVACGSGHTVALKNDGTVWACGDNEYGQLGDGTTRNRTTPVQVGGLSRVIAIAAGDGYTIALKNDGTVWACGDNEYGQLGDGTTANRTTPVQVSDLGGVAAIAAGYRHTAVLKNDGTVWAWGYNYYGQLGDGTTIHSMTPVQVNELDGVTAIAAGYRHTIALKNDGTVWSWGYNKYGQLGDETKTDSATPVQVNGLGEVTAIATRYYHTVALKNDGTIWAWGYNEYGQLGDGTTIDWNTPVQVSGLNGVTAITAGDLHTVALKNDGTVWAWGYNYYGQLGDGTTIDRNTPVQVSGLGGVTAIAAGELYTVTLKNDGTVWAWGSDAGGQLGDGTTIYRMAPVQVSGLGGVAAIAAGCRHTIALKNDGTVWAWGYNYYGQLGDGTTIDRNTPVQVSGLGGVTAIAAGDYYTVVLKNDGTVWAWGYNYYGQLGDGTTVDRTTPVQVRGLSGVTAIAAGYGHTVVLKNDGTVWAWGANYSGQLGDGTTTNRTTPVQVSGLDGVAAIAAGYRHTIALKNDGTAWAWGYNYYGQLGDGTTTNRTTPVQVSGLGGVTAITAGYDHTVALKNDGTVWAWGYNYSGQLGDGTTTNRTTPVQVSGLSEVTAIAAGDGHTVALKNDGTVWAWGYNEYGQLGDWTRTYRTTPVQVSGLSEVAAVAVGYYYTVALKNDETVWAWGYNYYGQLGNGEAGYYSLPKWSFGTPADVPFTPTYTVDCTAGKEFSLVLKAQNFTSLIGRAFTVTYAPGSIANVTDLCAVTYRRETTTGVIQGTGITITQVSPGEIKFTVDRAIESGKNWSGVLNIITFIPAVSGPVTFTVTVE